MAITPVNNTSTYTQNKSISSVQYQSLKKDEQLQAQTTENNYMRMITDKWNSLSTTYKVCIGSGFGIALLAIGDLIFCKGKHLKSIFKFGKEVPQTGESVPPAFEIKITDALLSGAASKEKFLAELKKSSFVKMPTIPDDIPSVLNFAKDGVSMPKNLRNVLPVKKCIIVKSGGKFERVYLSEDGKNLRYVILYDSAGKKSKIIRYNKNRVISSIEEYNADGKRVKRAKFHIGDKTGEYYLHGIKTYGSDGKCGMTVIFKPNSSEIESVSNTSTDFGVSGATASIKF